TVAVEAPPAPSRSLWSRITAWRDNLRQPATPAVTQPAPALPALTQPGSPAAATPATPPPIIWPPAHHVQPADHPRLVPSPSSSAGPAGAPVIRVSGQPTSSRPLPPTALSPADLKKAIEKACGSLAREVKVTTGPDKTLTVRVVGRGSEA